MSFIGLFKLRSTNCAFPISMLNKFLKTLGFIFIIKKECHRKGTAIFSPEVLHNFPKAMCVYESISLHTAVPIL